MIVGFDKSSRLAREMCQVETVRDRFKKLTEEFVWKEYSLGNKRSWFEQRTELSQQLRNRRQIEETKANEGKGPISYYKQKLNHLLNNFQDRDQMTPEL